MLRLQVIGVDVMALVIANRVYETSTTTGTGAMTLAGAPSNFQTFSAGIGNGNTTYYAIVHQTSSEWEMGLGTYTSSTTSLSRDTVLSSSNAGAAVNFSAGTKNVFCDTSSGRALFQDDNGYLNTALSGANTGRIESPFYYVLPNNTTNVLFWSGGDTTSPYGPVTVPDNTAFLFDIYYPFYKPSGAGYISVTLSSVWGGTASYSVSYQGAFGLAGSLSNASYTSYAATAFASNTTAANITSDSISGTINTSFSYWITGILRVTTGGTVQHGFVVNGTAGSTAGFPEISNGAYIKMSPIGSISGTSNINNGGWV